MPRRVAVSVKNWAITKRTLDAMSWSADMAIDTKARTTATTKDAVAMVFSRVRLIVSILLFDRFAVGEGVERSINSEGAKSARDNPVMQYAGNICILHVEK